MRPEIGEAPLVDLHRADDPAARVQRRWTLQPEGIGVEDVAVGRHPHRGRSPLLGDRVVQAMQQVVAGAPIATEP